MEESEGGPPAPPLLEATGGQAVVEVVEVAEEAEAAEVEAEVAEEAEEAVAEATVQREGAAAAFQPQIVEATGAIISRGDSFTSGGYRWCRWRPVSRDDPSCTRVAAVTVPIGVRGRRRASSWRRAC